MESSYDDSIRSAQRTGDADGHSPENKGLRASESPPGTDNTLTDHMELNSSEAADPGSQGLRASECPPDTDNTLTYHIELDSVEAADPGSQGLRASECPPNTDNTLTDHMLEDQGEADLALPDNQEETSTGKDSILPLDQWKVKKIIGEEMMGGVRYYLVDWEPTLEPASNISKDLVKAWKDQKAKMQAPGMKGNLVSGTRKNTDQRRVEKRRRGPRRG